MIKATGMKESRLIYHLMNLSRIFNPHKNRFLLSGGLNLETLNPILSETNHI